MNKPTPEIGDEFKDYAGDIWVYIGDGHVLRKKDGNIGTWDHGNGLEEL